MSRYASAALFTLLTATAQLAAAEKSIHLTVSGASGLATPVTVEVELPAEQLKATLARIEFDGGTKAVGQLTSPALLSPATTASNNSRRNLTFVVPASLRGDAKATVTFSESPTKSDGFAWKSTEGKSDELSFAGRPIMKYMYEKLDHSSLERRGETYKVYHHVYDPDGTRLITKGPGGLFPHHRGLFFGFNKITYGTTHADIWHCLNGEFQSHEGIVAEEVGSVLGRQRLAIDWHGPDPEIAAKRKENKAALPNTSTPVFAHETRELTSYNVAGGTLIEFATLLESKVGKVKLDGDPQHAGFQFRATQDVPDKTAKETFYIRPDGKGEPGKFRNWPDDKKNVNLPWNAVCITLDGKKYTVCYLDHPKNPKEARFSERDYARFGSYFEYELDTDKPLRLNYRIWVQKGEMTVEQIDALAKSFVDPPKVAVIP